MAENLTMQGFRIDTGNMGTSTTPTGSRQIMNLVRQRVERGGGSLGPCG
jgi:hypothetical protein